MAFTVKQIKELYLFDTKLENIFINEFMTAAPGDYVKVYLLSLMYAGSGIETDNAGIAKQLSIEEEDVLKAWNYWESLGAIKKVYRDNADRFRYDVEFIRIKEQLYGKKAKKKQDADTLLPQLLSDAELKNLYRSVERITGRPLGGKELTEIASWVSDYGAAPEIVVYAYSYCEKNKKQNNHKYVGAIVKEWVSKQLFDASAVEGYLQEVDKRHFLYKRVLKAMGFARNATEEEKRIMDTWFDEMGFPIERVIEACSKTSGISNPNINYVNQVLVNWHTGKTGGQKSGGQNGKKAVSTTDVLKYYDTVRKQAEDDADSKKEQVYSEAPKIKDIDDELRACGMELSRMMVSGNPDKKQRADSYKNKVAKLSEQKANLLKEHGYAADYMEIKYRCEICKDSGTNDDGERCSCFREMQNEAELWQISSKN